MYQQICSWQNLCLAFRRASRGKRGQPNVAAFEHRLEENLLSIQRRLLERAYKPGGYVSFTIHEPKRRWISAAAFQDRVVHHALCNIIEPVFERRFIFDSYANRKGKGNHRALQRCQDFARRYALVLQCDIRQFFPSVDHQILLAKLRRVIGDQDTLWLIRQILASGRGILDQEYRMVFFPGDSLFAPLRPRGLPIGNLTSQFWANCYLNPFDHFVKRELGCPAYLRYVDDLLLFADNKSLLWAWKDSVQERLSKFRLVLHAGAHPRPVSEGIPFLGFTVFPQRRRLKRRKGVHFQRRLRATQQSVQSGELPLPKLSDSIRGWVNHAGFGNTVGLRKSVLGRVRIQGPCRPKKFND